MNRDPHEIGTARMLSRSLWQTQPSPVILQSTVPLTRARRAHYGALASWPGDAPSSASCQAAAGYLCGGSGGKRSWPPSIQTRAHSHKMHVHHFPKCMCIHSPSQSPHHAPPAHLRSRAPLAGGGRWRPSRGFGAGAGALALAPLLGTAGWGRLALIWVDHPLQVALQDASLHPKQPERMIGVQGWVDEQGLDIMCVSFKNSIKREPAWVLHRATHTHMEARDAENRALLFK
jgi:hypothetical protein